MFWNFGDHSAIVSLKCSSIMSMYKSSSDSLYDLVLARWISDCFITTRMLYLIHCPAELSHHLSLETKTMDKMLLDYDDDDLFFCAKHTIIIKQKCFTQ